MILGRNGTIRVVIADDSSLARAVLRDFLENAGGIDVVAEAADGRQAVERVREFKPDLVTMDLEMPGMSGLEAIDVIMRTKAVPILVVSSVLDAQKALEAVGRGALEAVGKPECTPQAAADFVAKVRLLSGVSMVTRLPVRKVAPPLAPQAAGEAPAPSAPPAQGLPGGFGRVFALAASTGGPQALARILSKLPPGFSCPVVVAQHISDGFAPGMVKWLSTLCRLPVRLGVAGLPLRPGEIFVSPSERHMGVAPPGKIVLYDQAPTEFFHPNCDVLLGTVAETYGPRAVGVILTGMSNDGVKGLARIRACGGETLAQNEESSVVFGMNRVAIEAGVVRQVLGVDEIAGAMIRLERSRAVSTGEG